MINFFGMKYFFIFHVLVMSGGYQLLLPCLFVAIKANTDMYDLCMLMVNAPLISENILTPTVTYMCPRKRRRNSKFQARYNLS